MLPSIDTRGKLGRESAPVNNGPHDHADQPAQGRVLLRRVTVCLRAWV